MVEIPSVLLIVWIIYAVQKATVLYMSCEMRSLCSESN